jgi:hypothetical protein
MTLKRKIGKERRAVWSNGKGEGQRGKSPIKDRKDRDKYSIDRVLTADLSII